MIFEGLSSFQPEIEVRIVQLWNKVLTIISLEVVNLENEEVFIEQPNEEDSHLLLKDAQE